jgi:hypothetical protein
MKFYFEDDFYPDKMMTFILDKKRLINISMDLEHQYTGSVGGKTFNCGFCLSYNKDYVEMEG